MFPVPKVIPSLNLIVIFGFSVSNELEPLDGVVPSIVNGALLLPVENQIPPGSW